MFAVVERTAADGLLDFVLPQTHTTKQWTKMPSHEILRRSVFVDAQKPAFIFSFATLWLAFRAKTISLQSFIDNCPDEFLQFSYDYLFQSAREAIIVHVLLQHQPSHRVAFLLPSIPNVTFSGAFCICSINLNPSIMLLELDHRLQSASTWEDIQSVLDELLPWACR
jgi:hypothetical protein